MLSEVSLWTFIAEIFPVSTITLILLMSGYIKGYIVGRLHVKILENQLENEH